MTNSILVTGAAGRGGAVGRTVTELLLKQGKAVRAMVRTEDERAQVLRTRARALSKLADSRISLTTRSAVLISPVGLEQVAR
jgi:nucleoside-diphosphate-sugar epimerase